jgi:hypothetical protein
MGCITKCMYIYILYYLIYVFVSLWGLFKHDESWSEKIRNWFEKTFTGYYGDNCVFTGLSLSSNSMKNGCSQTCLRHGGQPAGKTLIVFQCLKNSMFVLLSHTQTILDVLVHFPRSPEKLEHTQN